MTQQLSKVYYRLVTAEKTRWSDSTFRRILTITKWAALRSFLSPDQIALVTSTEPSSQPASMSTQCSDSEYADVTKTNPSFTQISAVRPHCEQATTVLGDKWYV